MPAAMQLWNYKSASLEDPEQAQGMGYNNGWRLCIIQEGSCYRILSVFLLQTLEESSRAYWREQGTITGATTTDHWSLNWWLNNHRENGQNKQLSSCCLTRMCIVCGGTGILKFTSTLNRMERGWLVRIKLVIQTGWWRGELDLNAIAYAAVNWSFSWSWTFVWREL